MIFLDKSCIILAENEKLTRAKAPITPLAIGRHNPNWRLPMIRMIDTRIASPITIIRSDNFTNWIADLLNGNGIDSVIPVETEYPKLRPVITDGIAKLDYRFRGNDQTKPTYRPPTYTLPIKAKENAYPECITQLQYHDGLGIPFYRVGVAPEPTPKPAHIFIIARFFDYFVALLNKDKTEPEPIAIASEYYPHPNQLHLLEKPTPPPERRPTNKDMNSAAGVRQCYMTITLNADDTITIRSNLDNRFPMENVKTPLRLKSGQVIKGKKIYTSKTDFIERSYIIIDNDWYRLTPTETGFKPLFFWYYELTDKPQPPLADFLTEQDEIQTSATREKNDPFREWQLADTLSIPEEYDISQMDEATKELTLFEKYDFASDNYELAPGKVIEKHIKAGLPNDPDDRKAADVRFAKTSLPGFTLEQAETIITDIRLIVDDNEALTKQYLSSIKAEAEIHCYDTIKEIARLADGLRELENSYQDDTPIDTTIEQLAALDDGEIAILIGQADKFGIDRDELVEIITEAQIANDPTRSHEAHARQFSINQPQIRPHDVSLTMQAAANEYKTERDYSFIIQKPRFIRQNSWSNFMADLLSSAYLDPNNDDLSSGKRIVDNSVNKGMINDDSIGNAGDDYGYHPVSKNEWKDDRENKSFVISFRRLDRNQSFNVKGQIINCKKGEHILIAGDAADKIIIDQQEKAAAKPVEKPTTPADNGLATMLSEMDRLSEIHNPKPETKKGITMDIYGVAAYKKENGLQLTFAEYRDLTGFDSKDLYQMYLVDGKYHTPNDLKPTPPPVDKDGKAGCDFL